MQSNIINVLSYIVLITTPLTRTSVQRLLDLEVAIAKSFPYHELLVLVGQPLHDQDIIKEAGNVQNIRLLAFDSPSPADMLERIALREAIGDVMVVNLWPDEEDMAPTLLTALQEEGGNDIDYLGFQFSSRQPVRWLENQFESVFNSFVGYSPQVSMATSACYSRKLAIRINASSERATPIKLSYEVASSRKRIISGPPKARGLGKIIRRLLWVLENIGSSSPGLLSCAALLCFASSLANIVYAVYVVLVQFIKTSNPEGWFTSNFVIAMMLCALFFTMGVFAVVGAHALRRSRSATWPSIVLDAHNTDLVKNINSNVETE